MSRFLRFFSNIRFSHTLNTVIKSSALRLNPFLTSHSIGTTNNLIIDESDDEDIDLHVAKSNSLSLDIDNDVFSISCNLITPKKALTDTTRTKISATNSNRKGQSKNGYSYEFKLKVAKYKEKHGGSYQDVANCDEFKKYNLSKSTVGDWYRNRVKIEDKVKKGLGSKKKDHSGREIKYKHL